MENIEGNLIKKSVSEYEILRELWSDKVRIPIQPCAKEFDISRREDRERLDNDLEKIAEQIVEVAKYISEHKIPNLVLIDTSMRLFSESLSGQSKN